MEIKNSLVEIGKVVPAFRHHIISKAWMYETFCMAQYHWLIEDLKKDTHVIDVGGAYGESAIFFAQFKEIKDITAYEADKETYRRGVIFIGGSYYKNKIKYLHQKISSLQNIKPNTILKIDCEGSEHQIFNDDLDLRNVYRIQIEYHFGVQNLKKLLESKGFNVKVVVQFKNYSDLGEVGWIYASKKK